MESPFSQAGVRPDAAFTAAAERFFELLRTLGMAGAAARPADWTAIATPLAGQFEQWLRASQSAGPWFSGLAAGQTAGTGASLFGPLPLGLGAAPAPEAQRTFALLGKLTQLQGQLAAHWSEIANTAAQRFVARLGAAATAPATPEQALKLYELWVSCAEEAYAATVHKEEFAHLQAELANTSAALLVEQRRHAEALVRAFGLPTRSEVDALYEQLKELRRQLAERTAESTRSAAPRTARRSSKGARRRRSRR
jgi:Poly(R)-hydroxyalkanoic acid synthase subunit (PHA_synth_III_E)